MRVSYEIMDNITKVILYTIGIYKQINWKYIIGTTVCMCAYDKL